MDKLELVQLALKKLGDASAQEVSAFIEQQHGVRIEAKFIPVFRASIREKERLVMIRQAARAAVPQAKADPSA